MSTTYAIDAKKKKAQGEYSMNDWPKLGLAEARERLVKFRFVPGPAEGTAEMAAFVRAYWDDAALREKTPTEEQQEALYAPWSRLNDRDALLAVLLAWRGPLGMIELVLGGGRYHAQGDPRTWVLARGPSPVDAWLLKYALRTIERADRRLLPEAIARCKKAPLSLELRTSVAAFFEDPEWAGELIDEWLARSAPGTNWDAVALLGSAPDDARFEKFFAHSASSLAWGGKQALLGRAIGRISAPVLERLLVKLLDDAVGKKWKASQVEPYAKALAHVRSAEVARVLATWLGEKSVAKVATDYFRAHPDLAPAVLGSVAKGKGKAAPVARAILDSLGRDAGIAAEDAPKKKVAKKSAPAAATTALPEVLVSPPWAAKKPVDRPRLALPAIVEGERCAVEVRPYTNKPDAERTPEKDAGVIRGRPLADLYDSSVFQLTDEVALQAIAVMPRFTFWRLDPVLAWLGERAVPHVVRFVANDLESCHPMLARAVSPRLALPCARAAAKRSSPKPRAAALAWLREHPDVAALGLVPAALGEDDLDADVAERALRLLVRAGHAAEVQAAAARYGSEASAALDRLLSRSPYQRFPAKMPVKAKWAAPERLGALELASGGALSPEHVVTFLQMLQISEIGEPYAGATDVLALLTPESRTSFAAALLDEYLLAGSPPSHEWVIGALALLAPSVAIARLGPQMRAWAAGGKVPLLHRSLEALAAIGSDEALSVVYDAGQRSRYDDTRDKVRDILEDVAAARGVTYEVLEDLLVPELGLEHGAVVLELGARTLSVRLGDHLEAVLTDAEGATLASFPRKAKSDDAEEYEKAKARYAALVEASEAVGRTQVLRFERALRDQRSWSVAELRAHVLTQPLVRHLARRLVWQVLGTDQLFRVAEDLTLADAHDEPIPFPPDDARVVLAHPLRAPRLSEFAQWISDYQVIQPFPQVGRETYALEPSERDATSLSRASGRKVAYLPVLALTLGMGWKPVPPGDKGIDAITRELSGGLVARLALSPGLLFGAAKGRPEQTLGALTLTDAAGAPARFAQLDALALSELLRDVMLLA